jgi:hypothetical protein
MVALERNIIVGAALIYLHNGSSGTHSGIKLLWKKVLSDMVVYHSGEDLRYHTLWLCKVRNYIRYLQQKAGFLRYYARTMEIYAKMFVDLAAQTAWRNRQGHTLANTCTQQTQGMMHTTMMHNDKERSTCREESIDPLIEHIVERYTACRDHDNEVDTG